MAMIAVLLAACGGDGNTGGGDSNPPPQNNAPDDLVVYYYTDHPEGKLIAGMPFGLSAEATDADGDSLAFNWELLSTPDGTDTGKEWSGEYIEYTPPAKGDYVYRVTASDGSDKTEFEFYMPIAENLEPEIVIAANKTAFLGTPIAFDASDSSDPEGLPLVYRWEIVDGPDGHAAEIDVAGSRVEALFDLAGSYQLAVAVKDGVNEVTKTLDVDVLAAPTTVAGMIIDAERSEQLDAIVIVTASPSTLQRYDIATGSLESVSLSRSPLSVSVSPDGMQAAVGQDAHVELVDLSAMSLLDDFPVGTIAQDIVHGGNGYLYAFPAEDQWEDIYSIAIADGTVTTDSGIYEDTQAKLHPDGDRIYGANRNLSPSDIERYDTSGGTALYDDDSPYHGTYPMCGNIWISEDGERLFTACGNTFTATGTDGTDMIYNGKLPADRVKHVDHSSDTGNSIYVEDVPWYEDDATHYVVVVDSTLEEIERYAIPDMDTLEKAYEETALFAFHSADGTRRFMLFEKTGDDVGSYILELTN